MSDACENSSKKTGTMFCAQASIPLQDRKKNGQELRVASIATFGSVIRGQ